MCRGLTPQQALDRIGPWILAIIENASDLLMDGDVLFDAERYPRATAMAYFALEELGKAMNLLSLVAELGLGVEPHWPMYEATFVGHTLKLKMINRAVAFMGKEAEAISAEDWLEIAYRDLKRPMRELSLYVDVQRDGTISKPSDLIDRETARNYMAAGFEAMGVAIELVHNLPKAVKRLEAADQESRKSFLASREAWLEKQRSHRKVAATTMLDELDERIKSERVS
jgi:AbiV family abortive infection protein